MSRTIVFAIEDLTSYRTLAPVMDGFAESADVEVLLLDALYESTGDHRVVEIDADEFDFDCRDFTDYVRINHPLFTRFSRSTAENLVHRMIADNVSSSIPYEIDRYVAEVDPDVFVAAVDMLPFVRHLIRKLSDCDCLTVVVQHGIYQEFMDYSYIRSRSIPPSFSPRFQSIENMKRRIGYPNGITIYGHSYLDLVCSMGEFFTQRLSELRTGYPYSDNTVLSTTGTPEYDLELREYDSNAGDVLFLSQQQYEAGKWNKDSQLELTEILEKVNEKSQVTIRPHPKDSKEKLNYFRSKFAVSHNKPLKEDIREHDIILTINSTALFESVIQGKPSGVIHVPDYDIDFEPFIHEHLIQIRDGNEDLANLAERRSVNTQHDYLQQYCYMPVLDGNTQEETSTELILNQINKFHPEDS